MKMTPLSFYEYTRRSLDSLAKKKGITDLSRYYQLTDYAEGSFLNLYSDKAQVFAQICLHAQNATLISNIVNFESNLSFLKEVLCGFDTDCFLLKYPANEVDKSVLRLVEDLRYNDELGVGLKWDSTKSKSANKDRLVKRYAQTLINGAVYINSFENRKSLLDDLINNYQNGNYRELIKYFRNKNPVGFSIALTCDFLKEFDQAFMDLPKPDIHIKDTLCALFERKAGYYSSEEREYECIGEMQKLTKDINKELDVKDHITVYQLDRMIWLICSGNFFLDYSQNAKSAFLNGIKQYYN